MSDASSLKVSPDGPPFTPDEARDLVPMGRNSFYAALKRDEIKHTRVGGKIFVMRRPFLRQFGFID